MAWEERAMGAHVEAAGVETVEQDCSLNRAMSHVEPHSAMGVPLTRRMDYCRRDITDGSLAGGRIDGV
jgi:hypothetical protein